jgi:hypothetical protein
MESLATGMVLVSALATPYGVGSIRASASVYSARTVVDAVALVVRSPALARTRFVASKPGDAIQAAAAVTQVPYRGFTIYAYPFGSAAPAPDTGIVEPQHLRQYRANGTGTLIRSVHPSALIFGHHVTGSARMVEVDLGPRRQPTEVVSWLTDAGNRLWIIQAAGPLSSNRAAVAAFAAGTSVQAGNISTPTTVPSSELISPGPASLLTPHVIVVPGATADPPPARFPPWWSGSCDEDDYPGSFPLSSWDGLTACGPGPNRGGWDRTVAFFPHAWGEYEWECVELSMRWLYLEYGVRPYPANGSGVVWDYSRSDGGDLEKIANDGESAPVPGDVLSMEPTWAQGHTAVVTSADVSNGDGTIGILEQNMDGGNGTNTLGVVGNVVQPDYGMPVTGWLQAPPSVVATDAPVGDLVDQGGFAGQSGRGWQVTHSRRGIEPAGKLVVGQPGGGDFGPADATARGGAISQDISISVKDGESFCADAEVVTAGARSGARGTMTLKLLGGSQGEQSAVTFGPLPGRTQWTHVSTCVSASRAHSELRIQFSHAPTTPKFFIDDVDVHESLVNNGGFDEPGGVWRTAAHSQLGTELADKLATRPYEGRGFGYTSSTGGGGGMYQDVALATTAGDSLCADAEVVTAAAYPGARGQMTLWLLGESRRESSSVNFGPLPGRNQWTHVTTCVTATRPHSVIRIQFLDIAKMPRLGVDAVDVHQSFVENGGFNRHETNDWRATGDTRFEIEGAGTPTTSPYGGDGLGAVTTSTVGGGIYQDISLPTSAGESLCADAEVVTAATHSGARGRMALWLYGESPGQSTSVSFGPLGDQSRWTDVSVCETARRPHSEVRIQFYDAPKTPPLGLGAVDLR